MRPNRDGWPELPVDATLSGPPAALYLWLRGRGQDDELRVEGDASAIEHLDARMRLATH